MCRITIDGLEIMVSDEKTVLEAALEAGFYIPHLCYHPSTGTADGIEPVTHVYRGDIRIDHDSSKGNTCCNLCLVEIAGKEGLSRACGVSVENNMVIRSDTDAVKKQRRQNLAELMEKSRHPVTCITCNLSDGCDRKICSMNTPEPNRCCWKFHNCEFKEVASFIGVPEGMNYAAASAAVVDDNPVFSINYALCINCMRCVAACREISKREALGFVFNHGSPIVGMVESSLKKSGCKFCLVCADVCPTGAIREKQPTKKKSKERLGLTPSILPPSKDAWTVLSGDNLDSVPEVEGVFKLCNENKVVIQISGSQDLRKDLGKELKNADETLYFNYEVDPMFMMRERQLIQQHMEKHGDLPEKNKELDDLF
ncbi:MAG: 2Fe-2S iron-sulfur cluster-binding protein [Desulfobacterales bacterium]|jgi:Pyruvate/2-oxoacid:ferredoxin oxidoreductase delta subunit|nr:2Fe-2S iron-sulfur cluster-binding protein [Desulfobacterales bacterium]